MSERAPELHAKALLASIDDIGTAAAAIDEAADKRAQSAPLAPASRPNGSPVTPPK